jgi:hypothetical protein
LKLQQHRSELHKNGSVSPRNLSEKQFKHGKEAGRYRSVRRHPWGRLVAPICDSKTKERQWLGAFDTPKEATYAYDFVARVTRGMKARSNFRYVNSEHCIQSNHPLVALTRFNYVSLQHLTLTHAFQMKGPTSIYLDWYLFSLGWLCFIDDAPASKSFS